MLDQNWRKSTRSGGNGQCVEVRRVGNMVQMRDSKDQTGPILTFPLDKWTEFTSGINDDELGPR
jgi:uncharacterized protein DUF397